MKTTIQRRPPRSISRRTGIPLSFRSDLPRWRKTCNHCCKRCVERVISSLPQLTLAFSVMRHFAITRTGRSSPYFLEAFPFQLKFDMRAGWCCIWKVKSRLKWSPKKVAGKLSGKMTGPSSYCQATPQSSPQVMEPSWYIFKIIWSPLRNEMS